MKLNIAQRVSLLIGTGFMVTLGLFPPWEAPLLSGPEETTLRSEHYHCGYKFLFADPWPEALLKEAPETALRTPFRRPAGARLDLSMWLANMVSVVLATGGLTLILAGRPPKWTGALLFVILLGSLAVGAFYWAGL